MMAMLGIGRGGIHVGRLTCAVGLGSAPFVESMGTMPNGAVGTGFAPITCIFPGNDALGTGIKTLPWSRRLEGFARGCLLSIAGVGEGGGWLKGPGATQSGKILGVGVGITVAGKFVNPMLAGSPIKA